MYSIIKKIIDLNVGVQFNEILKNVFFLERESPWAKPIKERMQL